MMSLRDRVGRIAVTAPNWSSPIEANYAFKTDIITAYEGAEQRFSVRETARLTVDFDTILTGPMLRRHMADLAESEHLPFVVRTPWRYTRLAAQAFLGSAVITVSEAAFWLAPGAMLILEDSATEEAAQVLSVAGDVVTLTETLSNGFAAGSKLNHALLARTAGDPSFRAEAADVWTGGVSYDAAPGVDPQTYEAEALPQFEGRDVFLKSPNWRNRPEINFSGVRQMNDSDRGTVASSSPTRRTQIEVQLGYTGANAAESEQLLAFFLRMKGKRGSFWMPTWQRDLRVLGQINARTFSVAGVDAHYSFDGSDIYNVVIARFSDGSHQVNRVAEVALSGGTSRMVCRDDWSQSLTPATPMSWCPQWRFAADRMSLRWRTNEIAETTLAVLALPNEEPI
jgi:hypothetical protein